MFSLLAGEIVWICVAYQLCRGELEQVFQMGHGLFVEPFGLSMGEIAQERTGKDGLILS